MSGLPSKRAIPKWLHTVFYNFIASVISVAEAENELPNNNGNKGADFFL